jgi:hypothetical protein
MMLANCALSRRPDYAHTPKHPHPLMSPPPYTHIKHTMRARVKQVRHMHSRTHARTLARSLARSLARTLAGTQTYKQARTLANTHAHELTNSRTHELTCLPTLLTLANTHAGFIRGTTPDRPTAGGRNAAAGAD